jgi:stigma-specific protein Stig1
MKDRWTWVTRARAALPGLASLSVGSRKRRAGRGSGYGKPAVAREPAAHPFPAAAECGFDFDALAKDLASGLTRREALRRLGLGLAAGLLAELTGWLPAGPTPGAAAATVAPSGLTCFPEIVTKGSLTNWTNFSSALEQAASPLLGCVPAVCRPGTCCNNVCVFLLSDAKNCGACGRACGTGQSCVNGFCVCSSNTACVVEGPNGRPIQLTCCSGVCTNLQADPKNCGACGHACPSGDTCSGGQCGPVTCPLPGQHACNGICCASTQACCPGRVNAPCCDPGQVCCNNNVCANLASDPSHCGACGASCGSAQVCSNGFCCAPGQTGCATVGCVNLASDVNNCGTCFHRCPAGESCVNGHCTCGNLGTDCPTGESCCSGHCTPTQSDPSNCGACGHVCVPPANALATCTGGICGFVCGSGFANCGGPLDPPCVSLRNNNMHCGSCGNNCTTNVFDTTCCSGTCTNIFSDTQNCGDCGIVCGSTLGVRHPCIAGQCVGG